MFQDNTNSASGFSEDIRNARVQEGYPILATCLASIDHDDRCIGAWDVVSLVDPVPLPKSWRVRREVIDRLCEPLFWKFFGRVYNDRWPICLSILNGEQGRVGAFLSSLPLEKLEVDGLRAMHEGGDVQGKAEQAAETQESRREPHLVLVDCD